MLCGYSVMEYIRNRRLALAGSELISTDKKIIDIAVKYTYESCDSFTKAFVRFHGVTPNAVRKEGASIKSFAPLKINFCLKGGYIMDYRIIKKGSFTVLGVEREYKYENAPKEIPKFWQEHYSKGNGKYVCGMFGINIDEQRGNEKFQYLIADVYNPAMDIPNGFVTKTIPEFTWAVFPCCGKVSKTMDETSKKIFSEWLPNSKEYECAAGYCIEMYTDVSKYEKGIDDDKYYSELWIPVKIK